MILKINVWLYGQIKLVKNSMRMILHLKIKRYSKKYFTFFGNERNRCPNCFVCDDEITNKCVMPNILTRHYKFKLDLLSVGGPLKYFKELLKCIKYGYLIKK